MVDEWSWEVRGRTAILASIAAEPKVEVGVTALTLAGPDATGLLMQRDCSCKGTAHAKGLVIGQGLGYGYESRAGLLVG